jgi:ribosomal protein S27AE
MIEWGCECVWEGMPAKVKKTQIRCFETAVVALRKDRALCGRQGAGEGVNQTLQRHQQALERQQLL